jgi:two-component system nitrogen regulation response regulator NtrX
MQGAGDILIVDDETNILELVAEILEDEGYIVRTVSSGPAALAAIAAQCPALVLMDMYMPRMNGMMLLEHLAQQGISGLPIVVMTASPSAAEQVLSQKNVDYLPKPFDIDQLLTVVARYASLPGTS